MYRQLYTPSRRAALSQNPKPSTFGQLGQASYHPAVNSLGWKPSPPRLGGNMGQLRPRQPLLGQQRDLINIRVSTVRYYMERLLTDRDCVDKLDAEYGRSSIDALFDKVAVAPGDFIGLNSREMTIYEEAKACITAPNLWILIPLISGAVLFAVVGVGALIEAANRPTFPPSDSKPSKPSRGKEWSQKDPPWG